jgi:excisionase family DNA binding protein
MGAPMSTELQLQPIALSPAAAAVFLGLSKKTVHRLIAGGKIVARKAGPRTLVDTESLRSYYAALPVKPVPPLTGRGNAGRS